MENGQKELMGLFNGDKIFIIPKYQRAYSWEEKQLNEFIYDIDNQTNPPNYFYGTILFEEKPTIDGYEQIEIVDGQQRITTLIIFMKCLLEKIKPQIDDRKYKILKKRFIRDEYFNKLQVLDIDNDFFKTYIIGDNTPKNESFDSPSQKKLWKAKDHFSKKINNTNFDRLLEYIDVIEKTKVLTYSVKDTGEATLIFETTNDRGKGLTNLEKTKSFLMYKTYLSIKKPDEVLITIHDRFRNIYRNIDKINGRIWEDSILQYHYIGFESSVKKRYQDNVNEIKNKFNNEKNEEKILSLLDIYTLDLKESFSRFLSFLESKEKFNRDIFILGRVGNFYPLANKIHKYKEDNESDYYRVIRLIEIYSFRVYGINNKRSDTGQPELFHLARNFSGDFPFLISRLKDEIKSFSPNNEFERKLRSASFFNDINNNDKNYLFWKYENHLRNNYQPKVAGMSEEEFTTQDPKLKLTIEHITSQNPKNGLEFPNLEDENFKEEYLHSLGNLTIDPKSSNSSKGNNVWGDKDEKYFQKAPYKTQLELSDYVSNDVKIWDSSCIRARANKIIEFALNYWNPDNI